VAAPELSIGNATGKAGATVTVGLGYVADTNVSTMDFEIKYDETKLTLGTPATAAGFPNVVAMLGRTGGVIKVVVSPTATNALIPTTASFATIPFTIVPGTLDSVLNLTLTRDKIHMSSATVDSSPTKVTDGKVTVDNGGGPVMVALPSVVGMSLTDATKKIKDIPGFTGTVIPNLVDSDKPKDQVVGQNPLAGNVAANTNVTLDVSKGPVTPNTVKVPPLPANPTDASVRAAIVAAGLKVGQDINQDNAAPRGTVLGTQPAPGTTVAVGSEVRIIKSTGKVTGPSPVPTLSEWALMLLVLAIGTIVWMRRPQSAS
jgi:hypothetical protein